MSDYCYCDYEPPSVLSETYRNARKDHRCFECHRMIRAGERYHYTWGVWDGDPNTYKTCCHCIALREYTTAHVPCFCWYYGQMREDALEVLRDYNRHAPGLFVGGVRHYVHAERLRKAERRA